MNLRAVSKSLSVASVDYFSNFGIMKLFGLLPDFSYGLMSLRHHSVDSRLRLCGTLVDDTCLNFLKFATQISVNLLAVSLELLLSLCTMLVRQMGIYLLIMCIRHFLFLKRCHGVDTICVRARKNRKCGSQRE